MPPQPPAPFLHAHRLHGRRQFSAVFDAKCRKNFGPILVWSRPNGLPHPRLGLSVSRHVGNAVRRNRIKRLLREAFRFTRTQFPAGYDLVLVVRPHEPMDLARYQQTLLDAAQVIHAEWSKRAKRS